MRIHLGILLWLSACTGKVDAGGEDGADGADGADDSADGGEGSDGSDGSDGTGDEGSDGLDGGSDGADGGSDGGGSTAVARDPLQQLLRASMALRGIRPSLEEYAAVEEDPAALSGIVEGYLSTPEFGATVREMHGEQLRLPTDLADFLPASDTSLADLTLTEIRLSVQDAPLRLIEEVVLNGRPYSEIVTSTTLRSDAIGARVWGYADYDADLGGWQTVAMPDERPPVGILADGVLWFRHPSNGSNAHRGRANVVADALLCSDFLTRDLGLGTSIDLTDEEAVANALVEQPECVSCHQSLDPLASHLSGWIPKLTAPAITTAYASGCEGAIGSICYPLAPWSRSYEIRYERLGLRSRGYFGVHGEEVDLGEAMAQDPRLMTCAARRFVGYLTQTKPKDVPMVSVAEALQAYGEAGDDPRALARTAVLSDVFTHTQLEEGDTRPVVGAQAVRPEQLARLIADLTGFQWSASTDLVRGCARFGCVGEIDVLTSDQYGFRNMAGGMDGYRVTQATHTSTPTKVLVVQSLAAEAAAYGVAADLSPGATPRLLDRVSAETRDEAEIRVQLVRVYLRLFGERVEEDSPEIDDLYALFEVGLAERDDPAGAWTLVLYTLLQDPSVFVY